MRGGTLFSGIGAPECAMPWVDWRWSAEIDPFASAVHAAHFPGIPNLGDVNAIDGAAIEPVDLVVFGSPCQSFSVAGKREGMDDPRGNMALVGLRVISKLRPQWVVFENVPGLISSDKGSDLKVFLDELEGMGYVIDIDILDAQYHGVPQRRRRVFVCGQLASHIQQATTPSSALTILQCLAEILALTLSVLKGQSVIGSASWAFDASEPLHSLQRRMRLFGLHSNTEAVSMLEKSLAVIQASSDCGRADLDWGCGNAPTKTSKTAPVGESIRLRGSTSCRTANTVEFLNIVTSSSGILGAALRVMSECITSTASSETTESKIFTCSRAMLVIAEHIIRSPRSFPPFWSAASSSLTALGAFIDYARQASSDLFTDLEWLQPWRDFLGEAEGLHVTIGCIGVRSFERVLLIAESLRGDSPPRREAGQGVALPVTGRVDRGGEHREAHGNNLIAFSAKDHGADHGDIAPTLRAGTHDESHANAGVMPAIAFGGNRQSGPLDVATAVNAHGGPHGRLDFESETFVAATAASVRRLLPVECERLQGLPDNWTAIACRGKPAADGPRYRAIGNSMAIPCVKWIGNRIRQFEEMSQLREAAD